MLATQGCEAGGPLPGPGETLSDQAKGGKFQTPSAPQGPTPPPTPAPTFSCSGVQETLEVEIITDNYPDETFWTITEKCSGDDEEIMAGGPYGQTGTVYTDDMEVCANGKYEFKIIVSIILSYLYPRLKRNN